MKQVNIKLNDLEEAANFVEIMEKNDVNADVSIGKYCMNAKSLMGILTMDLSKPMRLNLYEDDSTSEEILASISTYLDTV